MSFLDGLLAVGTVLTDSESELDGKVVETQVDLPVLIRIVVVVNQVMLT